MLEIVTYPWEIHFCYLTQRYSHPVARCNALFDPGRRFEDSGMTRRKWTNLAGTAEVEVHKLQEN
jgi:hypothetical protein